MKRDPDNTKPRSAGKDFPFLAVVLVLALLLAAAVWQFYSLASAQP